jgi:hypothetical protein
MSRQIFVNLPVRELQRSIDFFTRLGFTFDSRFTDEKATCMIVGENSYVMLLVEKFFQTFTPKPVADASRATEVLVCLSCESRAEVEKLVALAAEAGATTPRAAQDHGFMFQHGFHDLDGHVWELVWMDPSASPEAR